MDSRSRIIQVQPSDLHLSVLPRATQNAFLRCITLDFLGRSHWYLAGGTALALQVGHRKSVDLDFFTTLKRFDESSVERNMGTADAWSTSLQQRGTLYGVFLKAKMSFIAYPFFVPSPDRVLCGTVSLLTPADIAAMKIVAISQRGRKRDFIDLYWHCLNREPLEVVVKRAMKQHPGLDQNTAHIVKSLTYFEDAEEDPMPTLFFDASWRQVKQYFRTVVPAITKILFNI